MATCAYRLPCCAGFAVLLVLPKDIMFSVSSPGPPRRQTKRKATLQPSFSSQVQCNNTSCLPAVCRECLGLWAGGRGKPKASLPQGTDRLAPRYPGRSVPSAGTPHRADSQAVTHGAAGALGAGRGEAVLRLDRGVWARRGATRTRSLGLRLSCGITSG